MNSLKVFLLSFVLLFALGVVVLAQDTPADDQCTKIREECNKILKECHALEGQNRAAFDKCEEIRTANPGLKECFEEILPLTEEGPRPIGIEIPPDCENIEAVQNYAKCHNERLAKYSPLIRDCWKRYNECFARYQACLDENVEASDLKVGEPRLLPDSPFYFLKNWARGIRSLFTLDPIKKAELRMKFANEKLMEVKKIIELKKDPEVIKKATENYQEEIERIKNQADRIRNKAKENPRVESFLDKFIHQQTLHQKLLDRLKTQVPAEAFEKIKEARERHLERFQDVMLKLEDRKEKIAEKLDKILEEQRGSEFKQFKNLEVLKNLEEKVPEEAKEAIQMAQKKIMERLQENLEKIAPEKQEQLKDYVEKISGEKEKQLEIMENLKAKIKETPLTPIRIELKEKLEEGKTKIIEKVEEKLERIGCPVWTLPGPGFCKEGRVIVEKDPETGCPLPPKCIMPGEETAEKLVTCCVNSTCLKQNKKNCEWAGGRVVDAASCYPNPCEEKKIEIPEKPGIPPTPEMPEKPTITPPAAACITLWNPVCGKDGKTYSNSCFAKSAGVEIDYKGVCKEIAPEEMADRGCCTPNIEECKAESVVGCKRATKQGICEGWVTPCPY